MAGSDIPIPEIQTVLHQPRIKEIAFLGELEYFSVLSTFCFKKELLMAQNPQGASSLASMSNFQIFMTMINDAKAVQKEDVLSVFTLLFPGYIAQFLPRSVFFSNSATQHSFVLDDHTFDAFQIIMQEIGGYNSNSINQELNQNQLK